MGDARATILDWPAFHHTYFRTGSPCRKRECANWAPHVETSENRVAAPACRLGIYCCCGANVIDHSRRTSALRPCCWLVPADPRPHYAIDGAQAAIPTHLAPPSQPAACCSNLEVRHFPEAPAPKNGWLPSCPSDLASRTVACASNCYSTPALRLPSAVFQSVSDGREPSGGLRALLASRCRCLQISLRWSRTGLEHTGDD